MSTNWFDFLPIGAFEPRPGGGMRLHGSKGGSSAPPPDPRLVEAQIKSLGVQDSAIQEVLATARRMAPIQEEQMQFGLDATKKAYDQSQEDRSWMLTRRGMLSTAQDSMASEAANFNTDAKREELAAQATADVNSAFSSARDQSARSLARRGINPASGNALATENQMTIAQAASGAGAANNARTAARMEGRALTDRVTNSLAGYPSMASGSTMSGASLAAGGLGIANNGLAGMNSGSTSAAQMAGSMGSNASGMFGAMASYKNGQDQLNQGDSLASTLGGLGGAAVGAAKLAPVLGFGAKSAGAAALIAGSDRRLKENIIEVGQDEQTGLKLYEFNYLSDTAKRYRGVMADEVAAYMPDAVVRGLDGFMLVDYGRLGLTMAEV